MLYLMRHGKTDWNEKHKLQGSVDIPLNDEGRVMAGKAAKQYSDVHFDVCYCSPLLRAKETAEIFLKNRNIPIIFDDRLREMSFGVCEGSYNYFDDEANPINILFKHPEQYKAVENGESLSELFTRTGEFLKEIINPLLEENKDILIVGHGAMNSSIICQRKGKPIKEFWSEGIENCKLKIL